jgi:hypothetical protein
VRLEVRQGLVTANEKSRPTESVSIDRLWIRLG